MILQPKLIFIGSQASVSALNSDASQQGFFWHSKNIAHAKYTFQQRLNQYKGILDHLSLRVKLVEKLGRVAPRTDDQCLSVSRMVWKAKAGDEERYLWVWILSFFECSEMPHRSGKPQIEEVKQLLAKQLPLTPGP